jgi:LuxR family maltose regulon positive regulatory protein
VGAILQTKLHRPRTPGGFLRRPRLDEQMTSGLQTPLTLVAAPAGYGKSMQVSNWVEALAEPCAWLSLDGSDSDVGSFLDYLIATVRTILPDACRQTSAIAKASNLPPMSILAGYLVNELDVVDEPFVLVLDDYHRIGADSEVHQLLRHLLAHPPRPLHLVIISRHDPPLPLAALRAGGQLTEIRSRDLRFTGAETSVLLQGVCEITLDDESVANLEREMEGWAAGLCLVTLALADIASPNEFLANLHGGLQHTQEYLFEEVLSRQTDEMRTGLLQSSILDRFCADLCDAVCLPADASGAAGPAGQDLVDEVRRRNLFCISLDQRGEWHRFHHLFRDLLRSELARHLSRGEIATLHARASDWLAGAGALDDAVRHALAAGDETRAARLVEQHRHALLDDDRWYALQKLLSLLPASIVQQRPELLLSRAWVLYHKLIAWGELESLLDAAELLLDDGPEAEPLRGEIEFFRGYNLYFGGDGRRSLELLRSALERTPTTHHYARGAAEVVFGLASQVQGHYDSATQTLSESLHRSTDEHGVREGGLLAALVFMHVISGDLSSAYQANQQLHDLATAAHYEQLRVSTSYFRGVIHFHRNELETAIEHFSRVADERYVVNARMAVDAMAGLALAQDSVGQVDDADMTMTVLREYAGTVGGLLCQVVADSCQARLSVQRGEPKGVIEWARGNRVLRDHNAVWWLEIPILTRCRVFLADGEDERLQEAEQRLGLYLKDHREYHNVCQQIQIMVLLSMIYRARGRTQETLTVLADALARAKPGRFLRPFVEAGPSMVELLGELGEQAPVPGFIRHVMTVCEEAGRPTERQTQPARSAPDSKPSERVEAAAAPSDLSVLFGVLTTRELEVLELLAERLQSKEIAERLFITTHTVNSHLKALYEKLGVHNRRQAVAKATELRIIGPR